MHKTSHKYSYSGFFFPLVIYWTYTLCIGSQFLALRVVCVATSTDKKIPQFISGYRLPPSDSHVMRR